MAVGSATVFICGMPAVRVNDMTTCAGPPDAVALGSFTVMIDGMPAARSATTRCTAGVVAVGCPQVMIG